LVGKMVVPGAIEDSTLLLEPGADRLDDVCLRLVSMNPRTSSNLEVPVAATQRCPLQPVELLTCGRSDGNTVVLSDQRVSARHFSIRAARPRGSDGELQFFLCDLSSNGAWVNNKQVGKGQQVQLEHGDEVVILPVAKVGPASMIGYVVHKDGASNSQPCRPAGAREEKENQNPGVNGCDANNLSFATAMVQDITCGICADVMHRTVACLPCFHNFCVACYLSWRHRSEECPHCRCRVTEVVRNRAMCSVVETFLKAHPSKRRLKADLDELDRRENEPCNRLLLKHLLRRQDRVGRQQVPVVDYPMNVRAVDAHDGDDILGRRNSGVPVAAVGGGSPACAVM